MTQAPIKLDYDPQPKQAMLHECFANEILYGGAAGPGKSHALRMEGFASNSLFIMLNRATPKNIRTSLVMTITVSQLGIRS